MDARYLVFSLILLIVGCNDPAKNLLNFSPPMFEYVISDGGVKYANQESINFSDDSLSRKGNLKFTTTRGDKNYLSISDLLNKFNKPVGLFRSVTIPPRHVILMYISYENEEGNTVNISLGKNWISYSVRVDSFGESSSTIYPAADEEILNLLKKVYKE